MAIIIFIAEFIKRKIERQENKKYEIGSLKSFDIKQHMTWLECVKHHELQVRSVCTLGHQTWQYFTRS